MSRPRVLDDTKRREVCALVTAGMTLGGAAAYVGCSVKTVRREREQDAEFDQRVRRAKMAARLGPLEAIRRASATHWRAAAWVIERQDRHEARRRESRRERVQVEEVVEKVKEVVRREVDSLPRVWAIEEQIDDIAAGCAPAGARAPAARTPEAQLREVMASIERGWAERDPEEIEEYLDTEEADTDEADPEEADPEEASPVAVALREVAAGIAATIDEEEPDSEALDTEESDVGASDTVGFVPSGSDEGTKPAGDCPPQNSGDTAREALSEIHSSSAAGVLSPSFVFSDKTNRTKRAGRVAPPIETTTPTTAPG